MFNDFAGTSMEASLDFFLSATAAMYLRERRWRRAHCQLCSILLKPALKILLYCQRPVNIHYEMLFNTLKYIQYRQIYVCKAQTPIVSLGFGQLDYEQLLTLRLTWTVCKILCWHTKAHRKMYKE
jgi:hypothetical protein